MKAREVKKQLQRRYDNGEFPDRETLLAYGEAQGWTIWRNRETYVTFGDEGWEGNQKRIRIKVSFDSEPKSEAPKVRQWQSGISIFEKPYLTKGYLEREPFSTPIFDMRWVYIIFAQAHGETAAYVGQAARVTRRVKGHMRSRSDKSSGPLQSWAKGQGALLQFVIAGSVAGELGKAEVTRRATALEGFWTERARLNGVHLPGVESWGQFPAQPPDPEHKQKWAAAMKAAKPLDDILAGGLDFESLCLEDANFETVRRQFLRARGEVILAEFLRKHEVETEPAYSSAS